MGTHFCTTQFGLRGSIFTMAVLVTAVATAANPHVAFDATSVVACRDVTPSGFTAEYPGEKLIEAEFLLTTRLTQGNLDRVHEIYFDIRSRDRRLRVLDFTPTARYVSNVEGTIEVIETTEDTDSSGASLAGTVKAPDSPVKASVTPSASFGKSHRDAVTEKYHRVAPKQAILVSGTTHQGHGLFIKRFPSPLAPLEGTETIICRFIVPENWEGDWVEVRCRSRGLKKKSFGKQSGSVGHRNFSVGLFLAGNQTAREIAAELAQSHVQLEHWYSRQQNRSDITKATDQISDQLNSLACKLKLGRCDKHRRDRSLSEPERNYRALRRSLASFSGEVKKQ